MSKFPWTKRSGLLLSLGLFAVTALAVVKSDVGIFTQSLKIGGTATAVSSAALEISSTTKGFLISRMTEAQRDAISSPARGLMVYNTDTDLYNFYDGSAWGNVGAGDVTGPASSTDDALVVWDGTTGKVLQDSSATLVGGTLTTTTFVGALTGNASTATALAANPSDCAADRFGNAIDAGGNLTCGQVSLSAAVSGTLPIGSGGTGQTSANAALNALLPAQTGNTGKYLKTDGTDSSWASVVGGGGINYVTNPDAVVDATGWTTYDDAATAPADMSGGTVTTTFTRTTTTNEQIRQNSVPSGTFKLSKDAADRQGEGVMTLLDLDRIDAAGVRPIFVSFDYQTSANYASGDIKVYVYGTDSTTVTALANVDSGAIVPAVGSQGRYMGVFWTNNVDSDYRLGFHITSTNANAYDVFIDNVRATPDRGAISNLTNVFSALVTDGSATTAVSNENEDWINGNCTNASAGLYVCTFNTGYFSTAPNCFATGALSGDDRTPTIVVTSTTATIRTYGNTTGTLADTTFFLSCQRAGADHKSVVISQQELLLSTVKVKYKTAAGQSIPNATFTIVDFGTVDPSATVGDKFSNVTTGASWKFTSPKGAWYKVDAAVLLAANGSWSATEQAVMEFWKSGSVYSRVKVHTAESATSMETHLSGSDMVYLEKDAYLDVRVYQESGASNALSANANRNFIAIQEVPDFSLYAVGLNDVDAGTPGVKTRVANIDCDGGSSINSQIGSWVSSVGNISGGACAITLNAGVFTQTPYCFAQYNEGFGAVGRILSLQASSATSLTSDCEQDESSTCSDYDFFLQCIGL